MSDLIIIVIINLPIFWKKKCHQKNIWSRPSLYVYFIGIIIYIYDNRGWSVSVYHSCWCCPPPLSVRPSGFSHPDFKKTRSPCSLFFWLHIDIPPPVLTRTSQDSLPNHILTKQPRVNTKKSPYPSKIMKLSSSSSFLPLLAHNSCCLQSTVINTSSHRRQALPNTAAAANLALS